MFVFDAWLVLWWYVLNVWKCYFISTLHDAGTQSLSTFKYTIIVNSFCQTTLLWNDFAAIFFIFCVHLVKAVDNEEHFFMLDCFKRTGYYKSVQCLLFFFFYLKQTNASLMYLRFNLLPEGKRREIKYPKINPHSLTTHYKNR